MRPSSIVFVILLLGGVWYLYTQQQQQQKVTPTPCYTGDLQMPRVAQPWPLHRRPLLAAIMTRHSEHSRSPLARKSHLHSVVNWPEE